MNTKKTSHYTKKPRAGVNFLGLFPLRGLLQLERRLISVCFFSTNIIVKFNAFYHDRPYYSGVQGGPAAPAGGRGGGVR